MGVKGLTLYHLKSHLQVWLIQIHISFMLLILLYVLETLLRHCQCLSCWLDVSPSFCFFLYLYLFFHLLSAFRNLGLASSPTRISMITRLRMVWEVTLLSRVPQCFFFCLWTFLIFTLHDSSFYIDKIFLHWHAASALELQRNTASSSAMIGRNMNEYASLSSSKSVETNLHANDFENIFHLLNSSLSFSFDSLLGRGGNSGIFVEYVCVNTVWNSNSHMVDAIRMQIEVQRRLHEQLEVIKTLLLSFHNAQKCVFGSTYFDEIMVCFS